MHVWEYFLLETAESKDVIWLLAQELNLYLPMQIFRQTLWCKLHRRSIPIKKKGSFFDNKQGPKTAPWFHASINYFLCNMNVFVFTSLLSSLFPSIIKGPASPSSHWGMVPTHKVCGDFNLRFLFHCKMAAQL